MMDSFLKTLFSCIAPVISFCWMVYCFTCVDMPWKVIFGLAPLYITFYYYLKEWHRATKLGFAHERPREISLERMQLALEVIERDRKKNKQI